MTDSTSKTPRIIRQLIRELINFDFDGNVQQAAEEISRIALERNEQNGSKRDYKEITASILYAIMSDKSHIKFSQIEMIATYIGIPVGALLFATRVSSSKRDGNQSDLTYLRSVYRALDSIFEHDAQLVTYEQIKEIGSGNIQLSLWSD